MKENIKPITPKELDNLEKLIKVIDPDKKVFGVTKTIIEEKKKMMKPNKNQNFIVLFSFLLMLNLVKW